MRAEAESLLAELSEQSQAVHLSTADVRKRASGLMALLHEHQWREVDLVLDTFGLELGAGD
jgi:hypothetical protein